MSDTLSDDVLAALRAYDDLERSRAFQDSTDLVRSIGEEEEDEHAFEVAYTACAFDRGDAESCFECDCAECVRLAKEAFHRAYPEA